MERSLIDLGTQRNGYALTPVHLDADRVDYLVRELDIVEMPVVLGLFPRFDDAQEQVAADRRGRAGLVEDGLIVDGRVHPDIEAWFRILERPRWYVAARLVSRPFVADNPIRRVCAASDGDNTVIGMGDGTMLTVRAASRATAAEVLDELGTSSAFEFGILSSPTDLLAEALDASPSDGLATARRLTHLDVDADVAQAVAGAMSTCSAHAEITAVAVGAGARHAVPHPVAFFDTHRGRIVATSSAATDGVTWSTLSPGTDGRIRTALTELIDRAAALAG